MYWCYKNNRSLHLTIIWTIKRMKSFRVNRMLYQLFIPVCLYGSLFVRMPLWGEVPIVLALYSHLHLNCVLFNKIFFLNFMHRVCFLNEFGNLCLFKWYSWKKKDDVLRFVNNCIYSSWKDVSLKDDLNKRYMDIWEGDKPYTYWYSSKLQMLLLSWMIRLIQGWMCIRGSSLLSVKTAFIYTSQSCSKGRLQVEKRGKEMFRVRARCWHKVHSEVYWYIGKPIAERWEGLLCYSRLILLAGVYDEINWK